MLHFQSFINFLFFIFIIKGYYILVQDIVSLDSLANVIVFPNDIDYIILPNTKLRVIYFDKLDRLTNNMKILIGQTI